MNMKTFIGIILIIISPIMLASYAAAGTNKAGLHASVRVLPYVQYDINHQELNLTLAQQDIDRGYKEISNATIFSVKTNSPNGYVINFFIGGDYISEVSLSDGSNHYSLTESGGEVYFVYGGMNYVTKELSFRFTLLSDTEPGTYGWPVSFIMSPM